MATGQKTASATNWRPRVKLPLGLMIAVGCLMTLLHVRPADAIEIRRVLWSGSMALLISGEIETGDSEILAGFLSNEKPRAHGVPVILLDSGGGSVPEAMRISELFDRFTVHTVVPNGAHCASACASIVFIAGKYRTIEEGGLLGQHSCSRNGIRQDECNDSISQNAVSHGVSYGSIAAFLGYTSPDDIMWFSREEADCYDITRYPFSLESGYQRYDPCAIKVITGKVPQPQAAWRVDFKSDGFRAFVRPVTDSDRELELNLFCDNKVPGVMFLSMDITGPFDKIKGAIASASLSADPIEYQNVTFVVAQADKNHSQVVIAIMRPDVVKLLKQVDALQMRLGLLPPYQPIEVHTSLVTSRKALMFVAKNCMHKEGIHAHLDD